MTEPPKFISPQHLFNNAPPHVQRLIGASALAYVLGIIGATMEADAEPPFEKSYLQKLDFYDKTAMAALSHLEEAVTAHIPELFTADGTPHRPNLNLIGIRQCTTCGCTDAYACTPTCTWVSPTTCSSCAAQEPPHEAA